MTLKAISTVVQERNSKYVEKSMKRNSQNPLFLGD